MNKIFKKTVIIIILFTVFYLNAQTSAGKEPVLKDNKLLIDTETAVSLALANNLDIKAEKIKYTNSLWVMATSWNVFLPDVKMSATLSRSNLSKEDRTTTYLLPQNLIPPGVYDYVVPYSVSQPQWMISTNFQLNLAINAAMGFSVYQTILDYQNGKIGLDIATNKVVRDTKKALYNLILIQQNIEITENGLSNAEKRYNQAIALYKNGVISEYDMLSAQVAYENIKPQLLEFKNGYQIAYLNFKQMIGIKREVEITINADISSPKINVDFNELKNKYMNKNLDIKQMQMAIQSLENLKCINISGMTPSFVLTYTMDPFFINNALKNDWFGDSDFMNDNWKQRTGMFGITVSLPVSALVPFSKEQTAVMKTQFQIYQNKQNFNKMKEGMELQLETTVMSMKKSIESIETSKLSKNLAERAYKKAEEAYAAGSKELLDVQNSELELKKAELNLLKEELNYTNGLLDLEYILNTKIK